MQCRGRLGRTIPIFHPIEAKEVRCGFDAGNDEIYRNPVARVRHGNLFDNFRAHLCQYLGRAINGFANIFRDALLHQFSRLGIITHDFEIIRRETNSQPAHALFQSLQIIRDGHLRGGRVAGIFARDDLKHERGIFDGTRHRTGTIERRTESDKPIAGNASIRRFQAHHSTEGRGLANRAARIRSERERALSRRDRRRASTGRAAGHTGGIPGVTRGRLKCGGFRRRAIGKFVQIGFPKHDRARGFHPQNGCGGIGRNEIRQNLRRGRGGRIFYAENIFDGKRNASKGTGVFAGGNFLVHAAGLFARAFFRQRDEGMNFIRFGIRVAINAPRHPIYGSDARQRGIEHFDGREFAVAYPRGNFISGKVGKSHD